MGMSGLDYNIWLFNFAFYYPFIMAYVWMVGGSYFYWFWERQDNPYQHPPSLPTYPKVSILLPCHNEGDNLYETVEWMLNLDYPNYDIIAVNDGSQDDTDTILDNLVKRHARLRVIHLASNQGKAMGLRMAALFSDSDYLIGVDGDALLDRYAVTWMMRHFLSNPRVGAVTGNPRIRNRSSLLGKLQVGEFTSIIGLIKRAQRVYGRVFTVSGVIVGFRKRALHDVGYWSIDMVTEDIDISWKLQLDHWEIRYEPNALCWILMPETLHGLWKQRLRWAQGGSEVLVKYFHAQLSWRERRMWPIYIELALSICWAYTMSYIVFIYILGCVVPLPEKARVDTLLPGWSGTMLGLTCLLQFALSFAIDGRYEQRHQRYYYWIIWYPLVYWIISLCTTLVAFPKALLQERGQRAVWVSPDRGIKE